MNAAMAATVGKLPSVWGKPKFGQVDGPAGSDSLAGLDTCMICCADVRVSVFFKPCGHKMCYCCVEQTRIRNIYKADKGVKCPFCRQYIEEFVSLSGEAREVDNLNQANVAAAKAAAARAPDEIALMGDDDCLAQRRWKCFHCNQSQNPGTSDMCIQCGRLKPEVVVPQPPKGKDLMKYSVDEILAACKAKWHPNLNKAFVEAGVPISYGKVNGDTESIVNALKKNGQEKLVMIVRTVTGSRRMHDLCQNLFGNYTVQDLMDAMAKLREVAREGRKHGVPDRAFEELAGPENAFGMLVEAMFENLAEMSGHQTCFYVVQRMISLCDPGELCALGARLIPQCAEIACNDKGCHVINNLLQRLNEIQDFCDDAALRDRAHRTVDNMAGALYGDFDRMKWMANHTPVGGKIFLQILIGALPLYRGLRVGSFLASYAGDLVQTNSGMRTVLGLLTLKGDDIRDILRDFVCCVAISLQGTMPVYAVYEPMDGLQLVRLLVQRLAEEGEAAWVAIIIEELVQNGEELLSSEVGIDVLSFALSLEVIQHQTAEMFMKKMSAQGLDTQILREVVYQTRRENRQSEKLGKVHWRDSIMSPWLKYHIESGNEIIPPPPPPPLPRSDRYSFNHSQPPPPPMSNHPSSSVMYPVSEDSIWVENSGYPPGLQMPPPPKPFSSDQGGYSPNGLGFSPEPHPGAAKLPADLMDSLNSISPEPEPDLMDSRRGLLDFGGIPAPPPAMYQYPGNWNFPDSVDAEQSAADLDVTEVINQFQDSSLCESSMGFGHPQQHAVEREIEGSRLGLSSAGSLMGIGGMGYVSQNGDLGNHEFTAAQPPPPPPPLHRSYAPIGRTGGDEGLGVLEGEQQGSGMEVGGGQDLALHSSEYQEGADTAGSDETVDARVQSDQVSLPHFAWTCRVCTYEHKGAEAEFLTCGICGSTKGQCSYVPGRT
ncbi:hypothetical protein BSKO_04882 [Bryopsis sp. KO-2023]|nr:hypothetical protein BSKO_04882 [Bryopsis sp. KO-2023]